MSLEDTALANLLTSDFITPEQWADGKRARNSSPEARVALALLHDAVDCLRYRDIKTSRGQKLYKEAAAWLDGKGDPLVTAEQCCDALDINIEYLRRGLQSYMPRKLYGEAVRHVENQMAPQPERRTRPISQQDVLRIVEMYRSGATIPAIREAVHVSYGTVYKIINQFLKPEEKRPAGRAATMDAKRERIRQMRERGVGINAIAAQMQVSTKTVYKALREETEEALPQPEPTTEAVQLGLYD